MASPLDQYKIVKELGHGGFAVTYLAEYLRSVNRRYRVIKKLRPSQANLHALKYIKEKFKDEARILEDLGDKCSQIPRFYDFFEVEGHLYIIQEYIEGETISSLVASEGPLSETVVRSFLISLLNTLKSVHSHNVLHRDINPNNIILRDRDGNPVLIDFGVVKELASTSIDTEGRIKTTYVAGAPGFISPQQLAGLDYLSNDLYSLGMTAIYALTGIKPDRIDSDLQTGKKLWHNYATGVSAEFITILDKAIDRNLDRRYQTAEEMREAIEPLSSIAIEPSRQTQSSEDMDLITKAMESEITPLREKGQGGQILEEQKTVIDPPTPQTQETDEKPAKVVQFPSKKETAPLFAPGLSHDWQGNSYLKNGKTSEAISEFLSAITADTDNSRYHYDLARAYHQQGSFDEAIRSFNRAIELFPIDSDYYYDRGLTHKAKEDFSNALSDFKMARQHAFWETDYDKIETQLLEAELQKAKAERSSNPVKNLVLGLASYGILITSCGLVGLIVGSGFLDVLLSTLNGFFSLIVSVIIYVLIVPESSKSNVKVAALFLASLFSLLAVIIILFLLGILSLPEQWVYLVLSNQFGALFAAYLAASIKGKVND
jgi:serine/threonine protein kinase